MQIFECIFGGDLYNVTVTVPHGEKLLVEKHPWRVLVTDGTRACKGTVEHIERQNEFESYVIDQVKGEILSESFRSTTTLTIKLDLSTYEIAEGAWDLNA